MKTLIDTKIGEEVRVSKVIGNCVLKRRIMDMGVTKGVKIFVKKFAPFGDPLEITVRGYDLSLRKNEAKNIIID